MARHNHDSGFVRMHVDTVISSHSLQPPPILFDQLYGVPDFHASFMLTDGSPVLRTLYNDDDERDSLEATAPAVD